MKTGRTESRRDQKKQRRKNWQAWVAAAVGMCCFLSAVFFLYLNNSSGTLMEVDGYPVTEELLSLYEADHKAEVTSYFYQEYGADPNQDDFWESSYGGEVPSEVLYNRAMEDLRFKMTERIEVRKRGIDMPVTLDEIKKALEEENKSRTEGSGIYYGPDQYGLMEYMSKTQMETEDQLKGILLENELKPDRAELEKLYEEWDQGLFDKGCKAEIGIFMYYGMKAGEYPADLVQIWEFVRHELEAGTDTDEITAASNAQFETQIEYDETSYDTGEMPRDNQKIYWLAEHTAELEQGQISNVLDYGASQGMLIVLEKEDYGKMSYQEAELLLRNLWITESYPLYIRERAGLE